MLSASYDDTFVVMHQLFRDVLELQSVFIAEHGLRINNNGSSFFDTKKCYFVLMKDWQMLSSIKSESLIDLILKDIAVVFFNCVIVKLGSF